MNLEHLVLPPRPAARRPVPGRSALRPAALAGMLLLGAVAVRAADPDAADPAEARVQALLALPVAADGPRELTMSTVEYPPGGSSKPHRHHAYVLVYALEGELEMQVAGQPLVHLGPGDTFLERPNDLHEVSRNASTTRSAKFLVVMLKGAESSRAHREPGPARQPHTPQATTPQTATPQAINPTATGPRYAR